MAALVIPNARRPRQFRRIDRQTDDLDDNEIRRRYRFGAANMDILELLLADRLRQQTQRNDPLAPRQQILIALRFYANGGFLQLIGYTFGVYMATVSRTIIRVTDVLFGLNDVFVRFPTTDEDRHTVKCGFYKMRQFPVVGCIDGTHVRIISPPKAEERPYVNRKPYHSINVQATCDHLGKFTSIHASWPGSSHDSHVLRVSNFCHYLETHHQGEIKQTMNIHMLKHVPECVRLYGPICTFSCFGFESMNSYIKGLVHRSGHVNSQIIFTREQTGDSELNALSEQLSSRFTSEENLQEKSKVKLGSFTEISQDEQRALGPLLPLQGNIQKFNRYVDGSVKLESIQYKKSKHTNNSTVAFTTSFGLKYGTILFFVKCSSDELNAFVKLFQTKGLSIKPALHLDTYSLGKYTGSFDNLCKHIVNVEKSNTTLVTVGSIRRKCILMQSVDNQMTYISYTPNVVEH